MKMMKRTLLMAAAVLALAACSDDDGPDGPQLVTETVTFEDATLNTSGILTGEKLAEEVTGDTGTYKEYSGTFYTIRRGRLRSSAIIPISGVLPTRPDSPCRTIPTWRLSLIHISEPTRP